MPRDRCPQPPPTSRPCPPLNGHERAQSAVEFVATLPLLALGALACLQALLLALALVFAQSAADRAARGAPTSQVVASIPDGWRSSARVERASSTARVRLRPPVVLPGAGRLSVEASSRRSPA